jgi:hypothetical protein
MDEPTFDIFKGTTDKDAIWLDAVCGLSSARQRMEKIAADSPGQYFVFDPHTHSILARIDTRDSALLLSKSPASRSNVEEYEIFKGSPHAKSVRLGTVGGCQRATELMYRMYARSPGDYFIRDLAAKRWSHRSKETVLRLPESRTLISFAACRTRMQFGSKQ